MGAKLKQSNFNGGIWSTILFGQTDLKKYDSAVERLENFLVWPHGPASYRPGFKYIAAAKSSSLASRLIPFQFSVTQAYIIEAGNLYFRFYRNQAQILDGATPYEVTSTYTTAQIPELKFCQSADVLFIFHKEHPVRILSRTGHTSWTLQDVNFNPPPMSVQSVESAETLTLGAVTGNGITFTASGNVFLEGDIGRVITSIGSDITSGGGRASIKTFVSATSVTCDIIDDFSEVGPIAADSWLMEGSPNAGLTPGIKEPGGAIVTLTSTIIDLFRSSDVGKYVRLNSGCVKITTYTNTQSISGEILKPLSSLDESTSWTLETDMWSEANGYPCCGTFCEERFIAAGSASFPETVWGSVVGDYQNFTPGIDDSDSVQFSILAREVNVIRWIEPSDYLIIGTIGGEWRLGPEDIGTPMTPLNVVAKQVTSKGSADQQPRVELMA
jgi:hypothetical protein